MALPGVLAVSLWAMSAPLTEGRAAGSLWMACNESFPGPNTHVNTTRWSPFGTNYGGPGNAGLLKDIQTGANLGVSVTFTQSGATVGATASVPTAGTPAFLTFNGYIDWANGASSYNAVTLTNGATMTQTFGGLDPNKRYIFKGTAVRGSASFTNRWALLEIVGADSFVARHTANVLTTVQLPGQLASSQAALLTGDNTSGDMVVWENIVPGAGGTFSVVSSKFSGTIPGGSTGGSQTYGLEAICLEEYEPAPFVAITSPADNAVVQGPTNVTINASAWSPAGISNVQFFGNGGLIGEATVSPYSLVWTNAPLGSNALVAVAFDALSLGLTSSVARLTMLPPPPVRITLVASNALYRWRPGTNEASAPVEAWRQLGFNDSSWAAGPGPIYYDDSPTAQSTYTGNTLITGMRYNYMGVFLRHSFVVVDALSLTNLVLRHHVDDGFVMWLNGAEICRVNMQQWDGTAGGHADANAPEPAAFTYFNAPNPVPWVNGTNVLAIQVFNDSLSSSDLLLDAELTAERLDAAVLPPRVLAVSPPEGVVYGLTNITVTFTKPVTDVQAGDLLLNGQPAVSAAGSGSNYTFAYSQPSFGPVTASWSTNQAIHDLDTPPKSFAPAGAAFQYALANNNAPVIATRHPPAGTTVSNLTEIEVTFSKSITNVEAADLLINGVPATSAAGSGASYTFTFPQPAYGTVLLSWSATNGITDLEALPTAFDASVPGASWSCTLVDAVPPVVLSQEPPAGTSASELTQVTVSFSEPVAGVDAGDLLVNGVPATGMSGGGANYTFTFAPPNATLVNITWATNHGITDFAVAPNAFGGTAWQYTTVDAVPPTVAGLVPPPGPRVRSLTQVAMTFNEPVSGVTAGDLLINGTPASQVSGAGAGPYTFFFVQPATGAVQFAWAPAQSVQDLAVPPNPFRGGAWTNVLDPSLPCQRALDHVIHISVDGLGSFYLGNYLSNALGFFPNFARLKSEGAATLEARCDYDISVTLPNHASMLTGRPVLQPAGWTNTAHHGIDFDSDNGKTMHNSGNTNLPYKASTLDVAHDRGLSTAFYSSKTKFVFYVRSYDATSGAPDLVAPDNGRNKIDASMLTDGGTSLYGASEVLVTAVVASLAAEPQSYIFLHFAEPDYAGHATGWGSAGYSNAVWHVDQQLGRIFAAIDSNPALADQIAIILTGDHGGGGNTSTGHSTASLYKNFAVPLFAWGPGLPSGVDLYSLFANRGNPGTNRPSYNAVPQPLRNGDSGNLALALLGLPTIPGSTMLPQFSLPPALLAQPQSVTNFVGATAAFSVTANASAPIGYQWQVNGTNLPGQTAATLSFAGVRPADAGAYTVVVTNPLGLATSTVARLTVIAPELAGFVELEAFAGRNGDGAGRRIVTLQATDENGSVLHTWNLTLDFTGGLGSFLLTDLPLASIHLSAKTAWHLRRRMDVTFGGAQATAVFTAASRLLGGDLDDSNWVDQADYLTLAGAWYSSDPSADIDGNGRVDLADYFLLASHWTIAGDPE